jgi:hypothetical protein
MRAREFVNEALDLISPRAEWSTGPKVSSAKWTDKTGAQVRTDFFKTAPGVVELSFSRTDKDGAHTAGRTNTAKTSGSAVFGQVAATLKDFLTKNPDIKYVTYRAVNDPARSNLYAKLAQKAGVLGLQQVIKTSDLPANIQQQRKAAQIEKLSRNTIDRIPTASKTPAEPQIIRPIHPPPDLTGKGKSTTDQFVLKRTGTAAVAQPTQSQSVARRISGNEYTNIFGGGKEPTNFQNQEYIKNIQAQLQRFPNDANLQAELDSWKKQPR